MTGQPGTGSNGPIACLVHEFPGWQIFNRISGLGWCGAYWQSADGRHRRYLVAPTLSDLLGQLRERARAGRWVDGEPS